MTFTPILGARKLVLSHIFWPKEENMIKESDLSDLISFDGFDYTHYRRDEVTVLQPRMQALGYHGITWGAGETDSFGPLSRTCTAFNSDNIVCYFMYG